MILLYGQWFPNGLEELPDRRWSKHDFLHGPAWFGRCCGRLLGGFINLHSGQPMNIGNVTNISNCFTAGTQGANVSGLVKKIDNVDPLVRYFGFLGAGAVYTFENAGCGLIYAPGDARIVQYAARILF